MTSSRQFSSGNEVEIITILQCFTFDPLLHICILPHNNTFILEPLACSLCEYQVEASANLQKTFRSLYQLAPAGTSLKSWESCKSESQVKNFTSDI